MENEVSRRLREDAMDIDRSLEEFMRNRNAIVAQQAKALDDYNEEMEKLKHDHYDIDEDEPTEARTDHNLNRHLNLSKTADLVDDEYPEYDNEGDDMIQENMRFDRTYVDVPKKEYFDKGLKPKPPMPDAFMKERMRDEVFNFMERSQTEEMQLMLEYEAKRSQVGAFKSEYLAEGLFTVQKENYFTLKTMIADYQPQGFGKAWGNDPDYVKMSEELKNRLGKLDSEEAAADADIKKNNKKVKKKKSGH
jgi:hypothetical protein